MKIKHEDNINDFRLSSPDMHTSYSMIEFLSGAAASFTNVIITYPISKIVFRQMLHGIHVSPAIKQIKYEGLSSLYRGILPPIIQKTASISLMFGAYDAFLKLFLPSSSLNYHLSHKNPTYIKNDSSISLQKHLDEKINQKPQGINSLNSFNIMNCNYKNKKDIKWYNLISNPFPSDQIDLRIIYPSIQELNHDENSFIKNKFTNNQLIPVNDTQSIDNSIDNYKDNKLLILVASTAAGALEAFAFTPLERVQTLLQHSTLQIEFCNTPSAFYKLWTRYGMAELYRGFSPILWRNGPSTAAFFEFRLPLRDFISKTVESFKFSKIKANEVTNLSINKLQKIDNAHHYVEAFSNFLSGALLGGTISTIFYPLNVVRTRMQSIVGEKYLNMYHTFAIIYKERNSKISSFFYGARFNFSRSLISWGIINFSYEIYKKLLRKHI
ncbi:unnamed protein product [Gordionus sp. m RMFG-2023]|uniref:mitochondrial nicotinamide adenine dinucleotide transporter SLC25A51-like n=1 Tax=Gordionus sp. m RMFG-2023 TaxID=3053472 RepID=UPI0030E1F9BF